MNKKEHIEKQKKQVEDNFQYFEDNIVEIKKNHPDKAYALLKDKKIIDCFDTLDDTEKFAKHLFKEDRFFSIQKLNVTKIDLGYQSYALFH